MPRRNKNGAGRKFDTRLNLRELAKIIGLSPKQRLVIGRIMKQKQTTETEVNDGIQ